MKYKLTSNDSCNERDIISSYTYEEKKSKFICYIFNIKNKEDALEKIDNIKKQYYDAKHVVYLYLVNDNLNEVLKFSDDGEPQGTGTKMILEMLKKEDITNVCVVIVRYFGGILLGVGPLARAYLSSFRGAYENLRKEEIIVYKNYSLNTIYNNVSIIDSILSNYIINKDVITINKSFGESVKIDLKVCINKYDEIVAKLELNK